MDHLGLACDCHNVGRRLVIAALAHLVVSCPCSPPCGKNMAAIHSSAMGDLSKAPQSPVIVMQCQVVLECYYLTNAFILGKSFGLLSLLLVHCQTIVGLLFPFACAWLRHAID